MVAGPVLKIPPPIPPKLVLLPAMTEPLIVNVPPLAIPPPLGPTPLARLALTIILLTVSVPALYMPPPYFALPLRIVSFERMTWAALEETVTTLPTPPPLTTVLPAPEPVTIKL